MLLDINHKCDHIGKGRQMTIIIKSWLLLFLLFLLLLGRLSLRLGLLVLLDQLIHLGEHNLFLNFVGKFYILMEWLV